MNYLMESISILPQNSTACKVESHFLYSFILNAPRTRWTHRYIQVGLFTKCDLDLFTDVNSNFITSVNIRIRSDIKLDYIFLKYI
jgi:hypothetical protein